MRGPTGSFWANLTPFSLKPTTLLVFAEARRYSCGDESPHDLVGKRSLDGGATWSANQMVRWPGEWAALSNLSFCQAPPSKRL
jgi:sialidase-1